jgi:hypothetical protein
VKLHLLHESDEADRRLDRLRQQGDSAADARHRANLLRTNRIADYLKLLWQDGDVIRFLQFCITQNVDERDVWQAINLSRNLPEIDNAYTNLVAMNRPMDEAELRGLLVWRALRSANAAQFIIGVCTGDQPENVDRAIPGYPILRHITNFLVNRDGARNTLRTLWENREEELGGMDMFWFMMYYLAANVPPIAEFIPNDAGAIEELRQGTEQQAIEYLQTTGVL